MNQYVTGTLIKELREKKKMTQTMLGDSLGVSDKTISKWETGRGYPDITLIEPLANILNVSVIELMSGESVINTNTSFNMNNIHLYVCPICGNFIVGSGKSVVSCHGILLPSLDAEEYDDKHNVEIEKIEDEYYININHEMSKKHYISFMVAIRNDGYEIKKLYPEGKADGHFKIRNLRKVLFYCNKDGLFKIDIYKHNQSLK